MPTPSDLVQDSKLEAAFFSDYTLHKFYRRGATGRDRKIQLQEKWVRQRRLGQGSYGTVWLETCDQPARPDGPKVRAVKEIPVDAKESGRIDYYQELEAIIKFSNPKYLPSFVPSFGWFESPGSIYIAMEYVPHGDLQAHLTRAFPEDETRAIAYQLAEGLGYMHENGFTHRDLKPRNILVVSTGPHWLVQISDFGISRRLRPEQATLGTLQRGTLGFIAPEMLGFVRDRDHPHAVDMWSLGAVVYILLTTRLFLTDLGLLHRYVSGNLPFPTDGLRANGVTESAESLLARLLSASPGDRLSATEALDHPWLKPYADLQGSPTSATSPHRHELPGPQPWFSVEGSAGIRPSVQGTISSDTLPSAAWSTLETGPPSAWPALANDEASTQPKSERDISSSRELNVGSQGSSALQSLPGLADRKFENVMEDHCSGLPPAAEAPQAATTHNQSLHSFVPAYDQAAGQDLGPPREAHVLDAVNVRTMSNPFGPFEPASTQMPEDPQSDVPPRVAQPESEASTAFRFTKDFHNPWALTASEGAERDRLPAVSGPWRPPAQDAHNSSPHDVSRDNGEHNSAEYDFAKHFGSLWALPSDTPPIPAPIGPATASNIPEAHHYEPPRPLDAPIPAVVVQPSLFDGPENADVPDRATGLIQPEPSHQSLRAPRSATTIPTTDDLTRGTLDRSVENRRSSHSSSTSREPESWQHALHDAYLAINRLEATARQASPDPSSTPPSHLATTTTVHLAPTTTPSTHVAPDQRRYSHSSATSARDYVEWNHGSSHAAVNPVEDAPGRVSPDPRSSGHPPQSAASTSATNVTSPQAGEHPRGAVSRPNLAKHKSDMLSRGTGLAVGYALATAANAPRIKPESALSTSSVLSLATMAAFAGSSSRAAAQRSIGSIAQRPRSHSHVEQPTGAPRLLLTSGEDKPTSSTGGEPGESSSNTSCSTSCSSNQTPQRQQPQEPQEPPPLPSRHNLNKPVRWSGYLDSSLVSQKSVLEIRNSLKARFYGVNVTYVEVKGGFFCVAPPEFDGVEFECLIIKVHLNPFHGIRFKPVAAESEAFKRVVAHILKGYRV